MTGDKIRIGKGYLLLGKKIIPLYSGEVHFWRIQAANWRPVLEKVKELGLDVIATYVAWNFHEIKKGSYDFTGKTTPQHDLVGFLRLTRDMGFKVMIRPGPYIYSEWPFGGPTEEAGKYHRLDPRFQKMAREWIKAVSKVIAPFQATRGGHILALQPDNEPYPAITSQGEELGCFKSPGLFKDWLARRYDNDIARLNAAWRSGYEDFSQPIIHWEEPTINRTEVLENGRLLPETRYEARILDSLEFFSWYALEIVRWTADAYRAVGIDVPFFSNGWLPYAQNFHDTKAVAPICGVDIYPSAYFAANPILPGRQDWDYFMEALKVTENQCGWGYSAELECGIWEGGSATTTELTPHAVAFMNLCLIANGLKGWNWYVIVNRDNWYHAPINQFGRETEFFGPHKQTMELVKRIRLHELDRAPAVSLVTLRRQRMTDSGNWSNLWTALTKTGIDFETVDCRYARPKCRLVLYGGTRYIEKDEVANLRAAVEEGATLVVFNRIPLSDRLGNEVNPFGLPEPDGQRPIMSPFTIAWGNRSVVMPKGGHWGRFWTLYFAKEPKGTVPIFAAAHEEGAELLVDIRATDLHASTYRMGFIKKFGKGRVIFLGVSPCPAVIPIIKELAGATYKIETRTPNTAVTFWENKTRRYAFIINRNESDVIMELALDRAVHPDAGSLVNVETGEASAVDASGRAYVPVKRRAVIVVRIQ